MKTNTKSTAGLKSRTEQSSTGNRARINFAKRRLNRSLETERLLDLLRSRTPKFFELAEVVGKWVWIQFNGKQPSNVTRILAELGFHWNNARQTWQHPCGTYREQLATYDPRKRYGSYFRQWILVSPEHLSGFQVVRQNCISIQDLTDDFRARFLAVSNTGFLQRPHRFSRLLNLRFPTRQYHGLHLLQKRHAPHGQAFRPIRRSDRCAKFDLIAKSYKLFLTVIFSRKETAFHSTPTYYPSPAPTRAHRPRV
jgi:hypothetical protein